MILYTTTIIDATSTYICRYGSNFLRCVLSVRMCACMYISGWVSTCMILRLWPSICVDLFATVFFSCRHHISLLINGISIIMMAKWKLRTISIPHIQETMHTHLPKLIAYQKLWWIYSKNRISISTHIFPLPLSLSSSTLLFLFFCIVYARLWCLWVLLCFYTQIHIYFIMVYFSFAKLSIWIKNLLCFRNCIYL